MKAVKKPIPIEVEQFDPKRKPWPKNVLADSSGLAGVEYCVWNELHGTKIPLEAGDYVNVTDERDTYPIKQHIFASTYDVQ